jgi:outer membrane protein assembly factor BamB
MKRSVEIALIWGFALALSARAENWPGFRGPTGMGISTETGLPLTWSADGTGILWKSPLPATLIDAKADHNQSSPIVWRDRVFVTTTFWPTKETKEIPEQHVTCYKTTDGKQLWDTQVSAGPWKLTDLRGGYCAPTPATDGERVYVLFGSSVLAALDWSGEIVWRKELPDWQTFDVAIASSPVLVNGRLLVLADRNQRKSTLTAYDPKTGDMLWEHRRPEQAFSHTTPVVMNLKGKAQLLIGASNELQSLDPTTGERVWWCKTPGDVTSPVSAGPMVYTDSGRGGPAVLVEATGEGDVTSSHVKWRVNQIPEGLSSPVIAAGYVYRLHNPAILKCFDLESGNEMYSKRLDGISVPSSPIATPDGRIYFASAGKTFVVKAGPTFEVLATNDLDEPSSASAAISQGRIFLKGNRNLFCIGNK